MGSHEARRVLFSGEVQGVGFRRRTEKFAAQFAVQGWVQNLPDGRVELWTEGERAEIERFLSHLKQQLAAHIADAKEESVTPAGYDDFSIRR